MKKLHILIRILILFSPFLFPWWASLILVLAASFYFDVYYEIILIGLIFDILYHSTNTMFGLYGFTLISCLLFIVIKQIKQRLILY